MLEPFESDQSTLRYAQQCVDYLSHDIATRIPRIKQPVLVLSADGDQVSSPGMAREMARHFRHGSFEAISGGSHYCIYENPEESALKIERFFDLRLDRTELRQHP